MGKTDKPTGKPSGKPRILMKRTGNSKPLRKAASAQPAPPASSASAQPPAQPPTLPPPPPPQPDPVDMPTVLLDGPKVVKAWAEQTERIATGLNCLSALEERGAPIPRGARPQTEAEWLRKLRTETAQHIVLTSIAAPVFAYMRVLGYNSICGKDAADTYERAKLAAGRMGVPHGAPGAPAPGEEELDRMVWEWRFGKRENYAPAISFSQAMAWLKRMLERRAATDENVRVMLETFEMQDRARREDGGTGGGELDAPGKMTGKRKNRDEEEEEEEEGEEEEDYQSDDACGPPSPRQSEERQAKKPQLAVTHGRDPMAWSNNPPEMYEAHVISTEPGTGPLPHEPHDEASDPNFLHRLETITLPFKPRIGSISVTSIEGVPREEPFDTGLLTPRDLKIEHPGSWGNFPRS